MNEDLVKSMDMALHGPRLYCRYCGNSKVLSPCYSCQNSKGKKKRCRGCSGTFSSCKRSYEICKQFEKENVLLIVEKTVKKLKTNLTLYHRRLTQLPNRIGDLTNLAQLNLSNNQLTQIPAEIGKLTNLSVLSASVLGLGFKINYH